MMRRGRNSGKHGRQFRCHKCGATPPWSAAEKHKRKCHKAMPKRHREDRT